MESSLTPFYFLFHLHISYIQLNVVFRLLARYFFFTCLKKKYPRKNDTPRLALRVPSQFTQNGVAHPTRRYQNTIFGLKQGIRDVQEVLVPRRPGMAESGLLPFLRSLLGCVEGALKSPYLTTILVLGSKLYPAYDNSIVISGKILCLDYLNLINGLICHSMT